MLCNAHAPYLCTRYTCTGIHCTVGIGGGQYTVVLPAQSPHPALSSQTRDSKIARTTSAWDIPVSPLLDVNNTRTSTTEHVGMFRYIEKTAGAAARNLFF